MSHVFDDSEDEFEDDYTESIKVIGDLEKKLEQRQKPYEIIEEEPKIEMHLKSSPNNVRSSEGDGRNSMRTRSSNRLKNVGEIKTSVMTENGPIEVLMEEVNDDEEIEYIFADSIDNDEAFQSTDSDDMVDDPTFETTPYESKTNENDMSEESADDKSLDDEDTGNL